MPGQGHREASPLCRHTIHPGGLGPIPSTHPLYGQGSQKQTCLLPADIVVAAGRKSKCNIHLQSLPYFPSASTLLLLFPWESQGHIWYLAAGEGQAPFGLLYVSLSLSSVQLYPSVWPPPVEQ